MTLAQMKADTVTILSEWGETLTVQRRSITYDTESKAVETWQTIATINGDWQPLSGLVAYEEQGLEVKSVSQIITEEGVDVKPGDRIYRVDGSYECVNYIRKYEDHYTIRMTIAEAG